MLDAKVKELINTQINQEFYSEYLYLAFANYFYDNGLDGFANWYDVLNGNTTAADAILDRIVHTSKRFTLAGSSLRKK